MYGDLRQDVVVGGRGLDGLRGGGAVPAGRLVPRSLALVGPRVFPKVVLAIETWKINKYLSTFLPDLCNFLTGSHFTGGSFPALHYLYKYNIWRITSSGLYVIPRLASTESWLKISFLQGKLLKNCTNVCNVRNKCFWNRLPIIFLSIPECR